MPKVLISDSLSNLANEVFKNNNIQVDTITDLSPFELKSIIHKYDGLVVRSATKATDDIISSGNNLKIIGRAGAGFDNIDLVSAKKNNVIVMNTPGGNTNATAKHTLSLLMSLYRSIPDANLGTHKGLWEKKKRQLAIAAGGKKKKVSKLKNVRGKVLWVRTRGDCSVIILLPPREVPGVKFGDLFGDEYSVPVGGRSPVTYHRSLNCKFNVALER